MAKFKFIYVPQGCYAEITSSTPDNVLGLVTSGMHSCCSIIVINSKESHRYVALCHADYITDLENVEYGISALIHKACPDEDFTNLMIYIGEENDFPRNDVEPIYLNQVQKVLKRFQVTKDVYINLESKLVCTTYSVDYGISILRQTFKITEERHEPQVIEEELKEKDIDMIMLQSGGEDNFPLGSSIVHARSYARKEHAHNFPDAQSMRFPPICLFNGSRDVFLTSSDIGSSCHRYGISWKRVIDDAISSYGGSERDSRESETYSSDFEKGSESSAARKSSHSNSSEVEEESSLLAAEYERQFSHILKPQGLRAVNVPGDGNCFFHAIARQLELMNAKKIMTHEELRLFAINYMKNNLSEFEGFAEENLEDYIAEMSQNGTWANNPIMQALVNELGIRIDILLITGNIMNLVPNNNAAQVIETLRVAYTGIHYLSVEPSQPKDEIEEHIPEIMYGLESVLGASSSISSSSSKTLKPSINPTKAPTSESVVTSILTEAELIDHVNRNATNSNAISSQSVLEIEAEITLDILGPTPNIDS